MNVESEKEKKNHQESEKGRKKKREKNGKMRVFASLLSCVRTSYLSFLSLWGKMEVRERDGWMDGVHLSRQKCLSERHFFHLILEKRENRIGFFFVFS